MSGRFPWISDDVLRDAAGPAAFGRGVAYQAQGRVALLSQGAARVLARVRGTKDYRVKFDGGGGRFGFGSSPARLLADVQMREGLVDQAWLTAQAHDIGETRLRALAEMSLRTHPDLAMSAYERMAEGRIAVGGAGAYDETIKLIRQRGEVCRDASAQRAYVAGLAVRHKVKRTFIQRLAALT